MAPKTPVSKLGIADVRVTVHPSRHSLLLGFETRIYLEFRNREDNMHRDASKERIPVAPCRQRCRSTFARATMRAPEMKTQSPSGSRGRAGVRISNLPPWLSLLCMVICIKEGPAMQISVSSTLTVITTANSGSGWRSTSRTADTASPASSSARSRPMRRSCDSFQANGRSSRSSATSLPRRASPRETPSGAPARRRRHSGSRRWAPRRSRRSRISGRL